MRLRYDAERIFDVVDLGQREPDFLAYVSLRTEVANGYLCFRRIVVDGDLSHVLGFAQNKGHPKNVRAKGRFWMRAKQAVYSMHCARLPCVESAGEHVVQSF